MNIKKDLCIPVAMNKARRRNYNRRILRKYIHFNQRLEERYDLTITKQEYVKMFEDLNDGKISLIQKHTKDSYLFETKIKGKVVHLISRKSRNKFHLNTCFKPSNYLSIKFNFWIRYFKDGVLNFGKAYSFST